jgi:hypothetical protein
MNSLKALMILVILFMSLLLFAQSSTVSAGSASVSSSSASPESTSSMKVDVEEAKKLSERYHISLSVGGSSNMYKEDSLDREAESNVDIIPSVYLGQGFSTSGRLIVTKEETGARNTTVSNARINLNKAGPNIGRDFESRFTVAGVAPTNEESRKRDRLQGAGILATRIKGQATSILGLTYTLSAQQNSHEFTVNAEGSPLVQYTLTNALDLDIEILKDWNLGLSGYYRQGWTYQGSQRQTYGSEINLIHTVAKNWEISAGIANEGKAFKANGTESNITIYDQNTTVVQAAVTFTN